MKKLLLILSLLLAPLCAAANPIGNPLVSVQSAAAEGSHILKDSPGWLNGFSATSGATAGYVMIIDSATVPADGAVTPKFCYQLESDGTVAGSWGSQPTPFVNGIVIVFSTTGCFSKTVSNTAFFSATVQ